jgi:hypothetical protein
MIEGMKTWAHDTDHCITTWDRVLIAVWRYAATREAITGWGAISRAFHAEQPQGRKYCSISIVERTSPPPGEHVRGDLSRFYRELVPQVHEAIIVPEGGGFRAAMVRGVGVALSTLAPRALPFKFVESIQSAATLVGPHLSPTAGGVSRLVSAVDATRTLAGVTER